jgi:hypothetical protein
MYVESVKKMSPQDNMLVIVTAVLAGANVFLAIVTMLSLMLATSGFLGA